MQFPSISRRAFLLTLVLVASVIRIIYLVEILSGPCAVTHRNTETDMDFFYHGAEVISGGDWLVDQELHPYKDWNRVISDKLLPEDPGPEGLHAMDAGETAEAAGIALWNRWYGGKTYHQEPLYTYFLAVIFALAGPELWLVFAIQSLCGVICILLVYDISRRLFSEATARVAAVLALFYGPMLFYEAVLLRAAFICLTSLLLVWLMILARKEDRSWLWLALGGSCGTAILLKSMFLLYPAGLAVYYVIKTPPRSWKTRANAIAWGMLGFTVALIPLVTRNLIVGAPPLSTNGVTPITLLVPNIPGNSVTEYDPLGGNTPELIAKADGDLVSTIGQILAINSPLGLIEKAAEKAEAIFHWFEYPNNTSFYLYKLYSQVLDLMPISTRIILALALAGLFLSFKRMDNNAPLLIMICLHFAVMLLAWVSSRLRVPLVVCSIPLAALALVWITENLKSRRFKGPGLAFILILTFFWYMGREIPASMTPVRPVDSLTTWLYFYLPELEDAGLRNSKEKELALWNRFYSTQPERITEMILDPVPRNEKEQKLAEIYSRAGAKYANELFQQGDIDSGSQFWAESQMLQQAASSGGDLRP